MRILLIGDDYQNDRLRKYIAKEFPDVEIVKCDKIFIPGGFENTCLLLEESEVISLDTFYNIRKNKK